MIRIEIEVMKEEGTIADRSEIGNDSTRDEIIGVIGTLEVIKAVLLNRLFFPPESEVEATASGRGDDLGTGGGVL